jgi:hypothetical protein
VRPGRITPIMTEAGHLVNTGDDLKRGKRNVLLRHSEHPFHKIALQYVLESGRHETIEQLTDALEEPGSEVRKYNRATEYVIAAAYEPVHLNLSFDQYEGFMKFMKTYFGIDGVVHFHDSVSVKLIAEMIGKQMHSKLLEHLLSQLPEISIILDAREGKHYLAVLFQTFDKHNRPHETETERVQF